MVGRFKALRVDLGLEVGCRGGEVGGGDAVDRGRRGRFDGFILAVGETEGIIGDETVVIDMARREAGDCSAEVLSPESRAVVETGWRGRGVAIFGVTAVFEVIVGVVPRFAGVGAVEGGFGETPRSGVRFSGPAPPCVVSSF